MAVVTVTFNAIRVTQHATLSDAFLATAAVVFLASVVLRRMPIPTVPLWLVGLSLSLLLVGGVSSAVSSNRSASFAAVGELWLSLFATPALIAFASQSLRWTSWLANLWVTSASINALVGLLDVPHVVSVEQALLGTVYFQRVAGLTVHPNHLGLVCAMTLPLAAAQVAASSIRWRRLVHAMLGVTLGLGLLASGSRAAFIGALVGMAALSVVLFRLRRRTLIILLVVAAAIGLVAAAVGALTHQHLVTIDRLLGSQSVSVANTSRIVAYKEALAHFAQRPLTGDGFQVLLKAHDVYLQLLQAGGLFAPLLFAAYVGSMLALGINLSRSAKMPADARLWGTALSVSIIVLLVNGLFENQVSDRFLYVPFGLLLGIHLAWSPKWWRSRSGTSTAGFGLGPTWPVANGQVVVRRSDSTEG
jgi:O-antigen ligase